MDSVRAAVQTGPLAYEIQEFPRPKIGDDDGLLRIEAGQVSINTLWSGGVIGAPFGGYKSSGFGRTVSAESILDYTQVKSVIIDGRA